MGGYLYGESYTVGFVEAHGLAAMIAIVLLAMAKADDVRPWLGLALAVHVLLGGANLTFWAIFGEAGMITLGVVVTIVHWLFVAAHSSALALPILTTKRSLEEKAPSHEMVPRSPRDRDACAHHRDVPASLAARFRY